MPAMSRGKGAKELKAQEHQNLEAMASNLEAIRTTLGTLGKGHLLNTKIEIVWSRLTTTHVIKNTHRT